jgi:hypothetical protein
MARILGRVAAGLAVALCTSIATSAAALNHRAAPRAAQGCNRACLARVMDRYLVAMVRHDPAATPLGFPTGWEGEYGSD